MRKLIELVVLVLGLLPVAAAFGAGWLHWGTISNRSLVMRVLIATIAASVVLQIVVAAAGYGTDRWRGVTFAGLVILGYSIVFFDIFFGLFVLPLAVILLILGLIKLASSTLRMRPASTGRSKNRRTGRLQRRLADIDVSLADRSD